MLDRFDVSYSVSKNRDGEYVLATECVDMCNDYESQIKNLEHQVGELEDQVFELQRQLAGKE